MSEYLTVKGLSLVRNNGKIIKDSLDANEKALDEGKWYLSGTSKEGKPRKRSHYVQYLRGKMDAYREIVDGTTLQPWKPDDRPKTPATPASVNLEALIQKAVAEALKALKK